MNANVQIRAACECVREPIDDGEGVCDRCAGACSRAARAGEEDGILVARYEDGTEVPAWAWDADEADDALTVIEREAVAERRLGGGS